MQSSSKATRLPLEETGELSTGAGLTAGAELWRCRTKGACRYAVRPYPLTIFAASLSDQSYS